ncbi:MAG: rod shape-determining protein MreD [Fimbriimonadaceae bacterium]
MNVRRYVVAVAVLLYLAAALQQSMADRLSVLGARPDFFLAVLAAAGLFASRTGGAVLGLLCGVLHGAVAGANLTAYTVSRVVGGFLVAWSRDLRFEPNVLIVYATAFVLTVLSQLILMFLAAPRDLGGFLGGTILSAVYNGVLALPVYALLKRLVRPTYR